MENYKMFCNLKFGDAVVFILKWLLLGLITLGIAILFMPFYFFKFMVEKTEIRLASAGGSSTNAGAEQAAMLKTIGKFKP